MRLLIVDDHILFRDGLVSLFSAQPTIDVVGQASSVGEAVAMASDLQPDLVLMDFSLPDGTGLEATERILVRHPEINIVFLTVHEEDDRLFEAIRTGAKGYLLKNVPANKLIAYLQGIERGEAAITPSMTSKILDEFARSPQSSSNNQSPLSILTTRELDILQELRSGASNREIASRLIISENTVKNHVRNILAKLGLKSRREAASLH